MKQFLLLLVSLFPISIIAQVDWDAYKDPGGNFYRIILDPVVNFNASELGQSNTTTESFQANMESFFRVDIVKERSLLNIDASLDPGYEYLNPAGPEEGDSEFIFGQNINAEYFYYFTERRGFHIQPVVSFNNRFGDDNYIDRNSVGVYFGHGRLENISTVYQGLRIQKQNNNAGEAIVNMSQDQVFRLADVMRQLDFNQKLDSRYLNIDNQSIFLENAEQVGFVLNDFFSMANMIDAYRFERSAVNVAQGTLLQLGFEKTWSELDVFEEELITARAILGRAINENWHVLHDIRVEADLDNNYVAMYSNRFTYVPIARTQITLAGNASYRNFDPIGGSFSLSVSNSVNYFINPQLTVGGFFTAGIFNIGEDFENKDLNFSIGFRYFVI